MARERKNCIIKKFDPNYIIRNLRNKYVSNKKIEELKAVIKKLHESRRFVHITTEKDSILESTKIMCSSGGLGDVVYAVPMYNEDLLSFLV